MTEMSTHHSGGAGVIHVNLAKDSDCDRFDGRGASSGDVTGWRLAQFLDCEVFSSLAVT